MVSGGGSFDFTTSGDTATAPSDYTEVTSQTPVEIPAGEQTWDFAVTTVNGDLVVEDHEYFNVHIMRVEGATLRTPSTVPAGILNDDTTTLTIASAMVTEQDSGLIPFSLGVYLSQPSDSPVTFHFEDGGGNATANVDYMDFPARTFTIPEFTTYSDELELTIKSDTAIETDEYFMLSISSVDGAQYNYAGPPPTVTILNDDWPTLRFAGTSVPEGDGGTSELPLGVYVSETAPFAVSFDYATKAVTATADVDYASASGRFEIPAGVAADPLPLPFTVYGDTTDEPDEYFLVDISNVTGATYDRSASNTYQTIIDDDPPGISVADGSVSESAAGVVMEISLSSAGVEPITVSYATTDGTATAGSDYTAVSGERTFYPPEQYKYVTIPFIDDTDDEPDETFTLVLSDPVGGSLTDGSGTITILDDDPAPDPSVPPSPDPSVPPTDTTPPTVSAPEIDFARLSLKRTTRPVPLVLSFGASDPSGIADTTLQHRIGTGAWAEVPLASARAVGATVRVSASRRITHRFRSRATDGASPPNTSPFAEAPAVKVLVRQDGSRKIVRRGPWVRRGSRAYFGGSVLATARRGARARLTATGSDFAIVSTKGPTRGKARVIVDGQGVATVDLFARRTKPRRVVFATSFPTAGTHTITFKALGRKNPRSRGRRVDLDAFVVLVRP